MEVPLLLNNNIHGSCISPIKVELEKSPEGHLLKSKTIDYSFHNQSVGSNNNMTYDEICQRSFEILAKLPEKRTMGDLQILEKLVENFPFFQKLLLKYRNVAYKLLRHLKLKPMKKGRTLFFSGDLPDNFYIILRGSVFVLLPKDVDAMKLEKNEETERIKLFLLKLRAEKAVSPFLKSRTMTIKKISIGLVRSQSLFKDAVEKFKGNMSHYYKKEMSMDFEIQNFDRPWMYFEEGVFKYNCINMLNAGRSFGELGLLIKKPRNATILCKEDSQFLYLEKNDYMILEQIDRAKILKKLAFFSSSFFRDRVTNDYVLKMIYNFQKRKIGYGQCLFAEDNEIDGCFVIKKGRVVIKKKIIRHIQENQKNVIKGIESSLRMFDKKERTKDEISEIELAVFERGQFVGEDDIIQGNQLRTYTAVSKAADMVVYFIQKDLLLQILKDKHSLREYFQTLTSDKLFFLNNKISSLTDLKSQISISKPAQTRVSELVRTEEEDLDHIHYPQKSSHSKQISQSIKSNPTSNTTTQGSKFTDSIQYMKRNALLGNNIKDFQRNGGFLRGKLFQNSEENYIEINSLKTKKEKILDVVTKNQSTTPKEPQTFIFAPTYSNSHTRRNSMIIRSPFNKYSFIKIDDKGRKSLNSAEKMPKSPKNHNKTDSMIQIQRRIQSAMPSRASSHHRVKSASLSRKNGGFLTSPTITQTTKPNRCNSSNELKTMIGISNIQKCETLGNERGNRSFVEVGGMKAGMGVIHQNSTTEKRRLWSGSLHKTKHNMFFFMKKTKS